MIVVNRSNLRKLTAGNMLVIPDPDLCYQKNYIYDVGVSDCSMMCRAVVVGSDRQHVQIRVVYQAKPTMLRKGPKAGYTDELGKALSDEPEGFGPLELEAMTREARERFNRERRYELGQRRLRSLTVQLKAAHKRGDQVEYDRLATELGTVQVAA